MHLLDRSLLLLLALPVIACASAPPPPPPTEPAPVASEPAAVTPPPTSEPESISAPEPEPAATPAPPPQPLVSTDAFYILDLAGTSSKPAAKIYDSDATCKPLVPGENGQVVRDFGDENWVVITTPADHEYAVISDGKIATVTLRPRCSANDQRGPRIVLYRVAKSVTAAKVSAPSKTCPKPQ